jgi:hypothetical protein
MEHDTKEFSFDAESVTIPTVNNIKLILPSPMVNKVSMPNLDRLLSNQSLFDDLKDSEITKTLLVSSGEKDGPFDSDVRI